MIDLYLCSNLNRMKMWATNNNLISRSTLPNVPNSLIHTDTVDIHGAEKLYLNYTRDQKGLCFLGKWKDRDEKISDMKWCRNGQN